jgi:hypothetical protein
LTEKLWLRGGVREKKASSMNKIADHIKSWGGTLKLNKNSGDCL